MPSTAPLATQSSQLPQGRMVGREVFQNAIRDALSVAAHEGWMQLVLSDADFYDWPLGERAVVDMLQAWVRAGRTFTMLACHYDAVIRQHARFVQWRVQWSHRIECYACPDTQELNMPSVLWSPHWVLQRIDPEHCVLVADTSAAQKALVHENLTQRIRNQSISGFASTVLGL